MKKFLIVSTALIAVGAAMIPAYANEGFYLEIGTQEDSATTKAEWEKLSQKHTKLLGDLKFYPKTTIDENGKTTSIIQAGVINDKKKAQKICNALFAKDVPCFVIEGIENAPPTMSVGMSQAIHSAEKEFAGDTVAPAPTVKESGGFINSITSVFEPSPEPAPAKPMEIKTTETAPVIISEEPKSEPVVIAEQPAAKPTKTEAKVAVAEAIPVPLSDDDAPKRPVIVPKFEPRKKIAENEKIKAEIEAEKAATPKKIGYLTVPSSSKAYSAPEASVEATTSPISSPAPKEQTIADNSPSGWLNITGFHGKKDAENFWENAQEKFPDITDGMTMKLSQPVSRKIANDVRMSLGVFKSMKAANEFCKRSIAELKASIICSFSANTDSDSENDDTSRTVPSALPVSVNDHGSAYIDRRKAMAVASAKSISGGSSDSYNYNLGSKNNQDAQADSVFWAQVAIADSKKEAESIWRDVKESNSDVVGKQRMKIVKSMAKHGGYSVRLGPTDEVVANEVCDKLQTRGIDCLVVATK